MYAIVAFAVYMIPMWFMMIFFDMNQERYVAICFASYILLEIIRIRTTLEEHNE